MQSLSRADVEAAFRELGEMLWRRRKTVEIVVYGGAAIMLQFEASFRTNNVDAIVEAGDHGALLEAAHEVAARRGWLRSWLSEAVANYVGAATPATLHGSYPSEARAGLRVMVAKPDYLLAMKLRALRPGTRDEHDAAMLAHASGITSRDGMLELVARYFPNEPPAPRRRVMIAQFAERLDAPPTEKPG